MRVLLTGATGFLGRHVLERLLDGGHRIRVLVRPSTASDTSRVRHLRREAVEVVVGTVLQSGVVADAVTGVDVVCHLAAALPRPGVPALDIVHTNVVGSHHLLRASVDAEVGRFVLGSSVGVYGPWAVGITEETPPAPLGPYGFSKLAAEAAVRRSDQTPWFDYQILRLAPVYGPGGPAYFDRLVHQILARGWIPPVEHGRWLEQWIHVSDAADAVLLGITNDTMRSNTFNLAGVETVTRPQLTALVRTLAGLGAPPSPDRWPAVPLYDTTKARMLLGFTPAVSLVEGLTELVTAHG